MNFGVGSANIKVNNKKIEKLQIKEGIDLVFEKNTELEKIGSEEKYSEYLDTIFPESKT